MRTATFLLIFSFFYHSGIFAQKNEANNAEILLRQAASFKEKKQIDSALYFLQKAEIIYQKALNYEGLIHTLNQQVSLFTHTGDIDQAEKFLIKAQSIANEQSLTQTSAFANTLHGFGILKWKQRQFVEAESYIQKSLDIKLALPAESQLKLTEGYDLLGLIAQQKGDYQEAILQLKKSLEIRTQLDTSLAVNYNNLGLAYFNSGNYYQAEFYYSKALESLDNDNEPVLSASRGKNYMNLGNVYLNLGELEKSESHYKQAIEIFRKLYGNNHAGVAIGYFNLSHILAENSELEKALGYCEKALAVFQEMHGPNHERVALVKQNLGSIYGRLGEINKAETYHLQALEIIKSIYGEGHYLYGGLLQETSSFYLFVNQLEAALAYNTKAHRVMEKVSPKHPDRATLFSEQGKIYEKMDNLSMAEKAYQRSAEIWENTIGDKYYVLAAVYTKLADVSLKLGQVDQALIQIQKSIYANTRNESSAQSSNKDFYSLGQAIYAYHTQSRILEQMGEVDQALKAIILADNLLNSLKLSINSEKAKLSWVNETFPMYETGIKLAINQYHTTGKQSYFDQAFYLVERCKSSLILQSLQEAKAKEFARLPKDIIRKERVIKSSFSFHLDQLLAEQRNGNHADSIRLSQLRTKLFTLEQSYDSLILHLEQTYPDYYQLKYDIQIATPKHIQQNLSEEQIVLSYFWGQDSLYIFTIDEGQQTISTIAHQELDTTKLNSLLASCSRLQQDFKAHLPTAQRYYQLLVEKPLSGYKQKKQLIIIPDGLLGYLPFEILQTEPYSQTDTDLRKLPYLIREYYTSYAYSATLLVENLKKQPVSKETFLGYAPIYNHTITSGLANRGQYPQPILTNLEGAVNEIQSAQKVWGGKIFVGEEATENNFKKLASNPAIIHLAMHALVNDEEPLQSRFLFYQNNQDTLKDHLNNGSDFDDGYLNVHEIYHLELNAQLAVLSACNTGVGTIQRGEGIFSLARAFMYAGVPSIITSLWRARDLPTQEIMDYFYANLKAGMSKDEALRQAKLAYIDSADPITSHPANWATFIIIGNPAPLTVPGYNLWYISFMILGFFGVFLLIWRYSNFGKSNQSV